jgi:hypothetical protein
LLPAIKLKKLPEGVFFVELPGNKILIEMSSLLRQKKARVIISEKCADDYFLLFLFFKLTIESKSIELFCTQLNSCMYKIKIKNVVHIIFVIKFSTSLFINFFVYILQIIQKLNHKHEFYMQPQILIPLDNMQPKILIIPASC